MLRSIFVAAALIASTDLFYDAPRGLPAAGNLNIQTTREVVNNTEEPTPTTVSAATQFFTPAHGTDGATETAAIYIKNDMTADPVNQFVNGIYIDQDQDQSLVGGAAIKVIHRGAGDAFYVAHLSEGNASGNDSSYGYESAMFGGWQDAPTDTVPKQENGFIATFQGSGGFQESVKNQGNTIGFQVLVHDDGTDPTDPDEWATNYGLFYANNSLSNAFVVRSSQYAGNFSQFKIIDYTVNMRPKWQVFNDGQMWFNSPEAHAGATAQNAQALTWRGHYWDGDSEEAFQAVVSWQVAATPSGLLRFDLGSPGSETLAFQLSQAGDATFAGNITESGTTFRIVQDRTISASTDPGNAGDIASDDNYLYRYTGSQWTRIAWDATPW